MRPTSPSWWCDGCAADHVDDCPVGWPTRRSSRPPTAPATQLEPVRTSTRSTAVGTGTSTRCSGRRRASHPRRTIRPARGAPARDAARRVVPSPGRTTSHGPGGDPPTRPPPSGPAHHESERRRMSTRGHDRIGPVAERFGRPPGIRLPRRWGGLLSFRALYAVLRAAGSSHPSRRPIGRLRANPAVSWQPRRPWLTYPRARGAP